ncbi:carboxypeptidase-like protein [Pontibacter ramchanderi]|uniref:Carboxypeptidase-like protein n=2 Tax=Pontibacter ramchanderi TaxID=1179743 RepID=A0A2N3U748_9BACT|nr:carboxypeptidase-like protein [Pontibacter ramchanderi]
MRPAFLLFLLYLLPVIAAAGTLRGRIIDENNQGLPFASIYIKETASGTASNDQGHFQLQLPAGTYTLEFKYVGYRARIETVTIGDDTQELNVQLLPEVLNLKEVVVKAADEDPAYAIMRNAIRLRKYHRDEVNAWSARVYMKGVARMDKVPGKVLGVRVVDVDTGIVYLSESVSELHFKKPNKVSERVISSKVSGKKQGFSFNQASEMNISFYDNLLRVEGLSERGFVSPLANNALFFYRFEYQGTFEENGRTINKIKVIPRRKNDPVFQGSIYIVDGSWRIHSTDLTLTKNAGIDFVDFIRVRQVYAPVQEHVWMPVSQRFTFEASGLGFKGGGYATGVYSNYRVQPAYSRPPTVVEPEPEVVEDAVAVEVKPARRQRARVVKPQEVTPEEQLAIHDEKLFSREVLVVEKEANQRDSAYWAEIRPVPLTQEEQLDYERKDSLEVIRESKVYKDSVDRIRNKPSIGNLFMRSYTYSNTYARRFYRFDPLVSLRGGASILQYNTVEGVVANVGMEFRQNFEDRRFYEIEPTIRYGFSNEKLNARLRLSYTYDPIKRSNVSLEGGRFVDQINSTNPISPFVNTVYTLLMERNYLKLYQRDYARVNYRSEILNGVTLLASLDYSHRMPLENTATHTFRESGSVGFTSNVPENAELADASFDPHQALTAAFTVAFRPGMNYISRPDRKINIGSRWPTFSLGYRGGIKSLGGDVRYATLALRISDDFSLGLLGSSEYSFTGGTFWGKENMRLMDYRHFNGNRTIFAGVYTGFQLLDYYRYSTSSRYLEGHYEHHFNGFLFNKIPLFRKLKWQEVVSLHYLNTRESANYLELGLGIEHIFKVLRVDFFTSFQEREKVHSGLRVGLGF